MKHTVEIPWVPPTLNQALRTHFTGRGKTKKVAAGYLLATLGKNHGPMPEKLKVSIQMYRKQPTDRDGAQGACKPFFDVLVKFGWAKDDREENMVQDVRPVIVDRKNPPKTVITIEEITN